jgi:hypothetical protein
MPKMSQRRAPEGPETVTFPSGEGARARFETQFPALADLHFEEPDETHLSRTPSPSVRLCASSSVNPV